MKKNFVLGLVAMVVVVFGVTGIFFYNSKSNSRSLNSKTVSTDDKYLAFLSEVYDTIQTNYWEKLNDEQLGSLWVLANEKISGQSQPEVKNKNKNEVLKILNETIKKYESEDLKKQFVVTISDAVLANLQPGGRSRLYTLKQEKALSDTVMNKTNEDKYAKLGVNKDASKTVIDEAYKKESEKWDPKTNTSSEAKEKYEEVQKAYQVLSDPVAKKNYDIAGVEPTMEYKLINSNIFYVHLTKFSPNSYEELNRVMDKVKDKPENLNTLIFDLRDNIGGAIDIMPYFLGPFIGYDQYAYQFLHQGEKVDFKTKASWLPGMVRYKKVVVLINENSQSTAELMASVLKKYNVGVVVGVPTKGWGTVERVFPINNQIDASEKNSIFLVHSLTLREDGQVIEGKGVEPDIDTRNSNWRNQLSNYFDNQDLINTVDLLISKK